jgi:hypothetical protein
MTDNCREALPARWTIGLRPPFPEFLCGVLGLAVVHSGKSINRQGLTQRRHWHLVFKQRINPNRVPDRAEILVKQQSAFDDLPPKKRRTTRCTEMHEARVDSVRRDDAPIRNCPPVHIDEDDITKQNIDVRMLVKVSPHLR